ncbi:hypothetical protein AB1Y20_017805 [Prymnesium parvum]|uniref:Uncharacterized protein n=1 Tax=Prymnesium parvum TaxID=97485 RepID=A0AB34JN59_PRYPA
MDREGRWAMPSLLSCKGSAGSFLLLLSLAFFVGLLGRTRASTRVVQPAPSAPFACPRAHPLLLRDAAAGDSCRARSYPSYGSFVCPAGCSRDARKPWRLCVNAPRLRHHHAPCRAARRTTDEWTLARSQAITPADFQLVVSFCRERLAWTDLYQGTRIIYSKCARVPNVSFAQGDELTFAPNLGREGETILRYVVEHYASLPLYVAFAHAGLNDESDRGHSWIREGGPAVEGGRVRGKDYGPLMYLHMLRESIEHGYSVPHEASIDQGGDWGFTFTSRIANSYSIGGRDTGEIGQSMTTASNLGEWFSLHQWTVSSRIRFYPSAVFVLNSRFILERGIEYYQQLQRELNYTSNPLEGHYFERSWFYLFSLDHREDMLKSGRLPAVNDIALAKVDQELSKYPSPPPVSIDCAADFNTSFGCCGFEHVHVPENEQCPELVPICVDNRPGIGWGHCVRAEKLKHTAASRRHYSAKFNCAADFNSSTGCCGYHHMRVPHSEQCPPHRPICVDNKPGVTWGHCVSAQ